MNLAGRPLFSRRMSYWSPGGVPLATRWSPTNLPLGRPLVSWRFPLDFRWSPVGLPLVDPPHCRHISQVFDHRVIAITSLL